MRWNLLLSALTHKKTIKYTHLTIAIYINKCRYAVTQVRKGGVRQVSIFSPNLFNYYSDIILRDLEVISGSIIGGYDLSIRYGYVRWCQTEINLQENLGNCNEEKTEEWTNHQLQEGKIYGCQQEEQLKMWVIDWCYHKEASR